MTTKNHIWLFIIILAAVSINSCSSRIETPVVTENSTIVYPAKNDNGISAKITFYLRISQKSGKFVGEGTIFTIKDKRNIRALINVENRDANSSCEMVFHIDWIGDNGKSFHRKQINLLPSDTSNTLTSSISISPITRTPGNYLMRLYLHRELIAEKKFTVLPEEIITPLLGDEIKAKITLYRKKGKKSGKLIGEGAYFSIKKKRNIRAIITFNNRYGYGDIDLRFRIDWIDENGKSFYKKRINLPSTDSTSTLVSSISISPGKRPPGKYTLQVSLFDKLIGEKKFEIRL